MHLFGGGGGSKKNCCRPLRAGMSGTYGKARRCTKKCTGGSYGIAQEADLLVYGMVVR